MSSIGRVSNPWFWNHIDSAVSTADPSSSPSVENHRPVLALYKWVA